MVYKVTSGWSPLLGIRGRGQEVGSIVLTFQLAY
jgi:hypothetical protein